MKIVVIGGGAAGLMAAWAAANEGAEVILLEKNSKCGKKIYITGKGRCNVTNDCGADEYLAQKLRDVAFYGAQLALVVLKREGNHVGYPIHAAVVAVDLMDVVVSDQRDVNFVVILDPEYGKGGFHYSFVEGAKVVVCLIKAVLES